MHKASRRKSQATEYHSKADRPTYWHVLLIRFYREVVVCDTGNGVETSSQLSTRLTRKDGHPSIELARRDAHRKLAYHRTNIGESAWSVLSLWGSNIHVGNWKGTVMDWWFLFETSYGNIPTMVRAVFPWTMNSASPVVSLPIKRSRYLQDRGTMSYESPEQNWKTLKQSNELVILSHKCCNCAATIDAWVLVDIRLARWGCSRYSQVIASSTENNHLDQAKT
jgi:hypothetical protein